MAVTVGAIELTGEIPTELGNLSNLHDAVPLRQPVDRGDTDGAGQPLKLDNAVTVENQLTGDIPTELGNFSNLETLDLGGNQLTGEIPTELGNFSNLETLDLGGNQLTGEIPTELGNLSNLAWLLLWGNQLTGEIPTELGNLSNLHEGLSLSWQPVDWGYTDGVGQLLQPGRAEPRGEPVDWGYTDGAGRASPTWQVAVTVGAIN